MSNTKRPEGLHPPGRSLFAAKRGLTRRTSPQGQAANGFQPVAPRRNRVVGRGWKPRRPGVIAGAE